LKSSLDSDESEAETYSNSADVMIDEPVSAIKNYLKSDLMLTLSPSFLVGLDFFIFELLISIKSLRQISSCCLDINTIFLQNSRNVVVEQNHQQF
jgi:hypothetical protein